ncbi:MAG TPA: fibronectin type III domain-containing protein [Flavobacterium sp.]|nr:fibronectin type III domain-containing protein [Flavobacterium sp.]
MTNGYPKLHLLELTSRLKLKICFSLLTVLFFSSIISAQCNNPINPIITSVSPNGATISWTLPSPAPYYGYEYYHTSGSGPGPSTPPDGSTTSNSVTFTNILSNATVDVWLRSSCASTTTQWFGPFTFTTLTPGSGCPNAPYGLSPAATFTPQYTQSPETVSTSAYAGQYSNVNVIPDRQYIFSTSVTTDYITITGADPSTVLAHGPSPLTFNSIDEGVVRYYVNTNSSCGTQQTARSRYITAQLIPSDCVPPSNFYTSAISSTSAVIHWTFTGVQPVYYVSTSNVPPNINATPTGVSSNYNDAAVTGLTPNTTYYYWVRSNCGLDLSNWAYGGSFSTPVSTPTGCTITTFGQNPTTVYTPGCFGNAEIISTNTWAGEYGKVNILPNKTYTFISSVPTDFITIYDDTVACVYASGITPLVWSSGANTALVRFALHTSSTCGNQGTGRTKSIICQDASTCAAPSSLNIPSITNSSAVINWTPANPTPGNGYQYYYSTTNTAPTNGTPPSGSNASTTLNLTGLNANTTYYIWIRSNCGSSQSSWVFGNSFTTVGAAASGCVTAVYGLYPATTFVPACFGITENIVTDAYAGGYTNVAISPNRQYTFASSVSSDYITISNADASVIYVTGFTPLVWSSGTNSGTMRFYLHSNAACGSNSANRTKTIICQAPAAICNNPSALTAIPATNSAVLNWLPPSPVPSSGYQYYYGTAATAPNSGSTPSGSTPATTATLNGLVGNTTYYFWVRANCGSSQSSWVFGNSFTTVGSGCVTAVYGLYPDATFVPACSGITENIVTDGYAGEYANVAISPNKQYTFASSVSSDYITISNADASVIYVTGITPLVWSSGTNSGTMRFYLHLNAACGSQNVSRTKAIICQAAAATCNIPSALTVTPAINSAVLNWSPPNPVPSSGYQYLYGTAATAPNSGSTPSGSTLTTTATLNALVSNTTYYFWVRANCGSSQSEWVAGGSFIMPNSNFCNTAVYGQFPSWAYEPTCSGSPESIAANAYAGEYSVITIMTNKQYTFSSSVATDFITITNEDGTALLANGITPLVWNSAANSGNIRYYLHTNSACGSQDTNRTRFIACASDSNCGLPANLHTSNITSNSCLVSYTSSASTGASYDIYFGASSAAPNTGTTPSGNITETEVFLYNLLANTTYYYWVRANCGTSASAWVSGGSLTTNAFFGCNSATYGLYPEATFTPMCTGSNETIATDAYAGEFSKVAILPNKQYRFTSLTDFITITNEAGNVFLASGISPLVWNSGSNSGIIRYFIHAFNTCTSQNQNRTRSISCSNILDDADFSLKGITIYPNPTSGTVNITARQAFEKIEIINRLGQQVKVFLTHSDQAQIDIHDLAGGIYFVKIYMDNEYNTYKIVKD